MLVYQGIALGSLTVGPMLKHVSPRRATQASLILNTGATFAFGGAQSATMLLIFRFLIGFLQAVPAVYFPVWVDEFAPDAAVPRAVSIVDLSARAGDPGAAEGARRRRRGGVGSYYANANLNRGEARAASLRAASEPRGLIVFERACRRS